MNKNGNKNSNKNKNKNVENNGTINTSNQINNNNYHLNKLFKEQNNIYPNLSTLANEKTNPSKRKCG